MSRDINAALIVIAKQFADAYDSYLDRLAEIERDMERVKRMCKHPNAREGFCADCFDRVDNKKD